MAFDLRRALLAKEERESTWLVNFEFRLRARTLRLLAGVIDRDPEQLARLVADGNDEAVIERLQIELPDLDIAGLFPASRQLIGEVGDPALHRLA